MESNVLNQVIDVDVITMLDDPSLAVAQPVATLNVKAQLAVFDPLQARLLTVTSEFGSTVYDIKTAAGEETSRKFRAKCVATRTDGDKLYKQLNGPVLEVQRGWRSRNEEIARIIKPWEDRFDAEIKAKEKAREDERQARLAAEAARVDGLRAAISAIALVPAKAATLDAAGIMGLLEALRTLVPASFAEFTEEVEALILLTDAQVSLMHVAAEAREQQNRELAIQAAELARQRAEIAAAAQLAAELDRQRQAAHQAAEQQRQRDADAASARAAAHLKAQQDAFDAERQAALAEQKAERAALAEQSRLLKAQLQALEDAKQPLPPVVTPAAAVPAFVRDVPPWQIEAPTGMAMARLVADHYDVFLDQAVEWLSGFDARAVLAEIAEQDEVTA